MQQSRYFSSHNICLKKISAIFLLLVFLFNLFGYQHLIKVLQQKADVALESRIDNADYDDTQLVEMRVSLNMPYQQRFTDFERHYGEININGKVYTYVKRKIEGDVLILKCIPNEVKQQLKEKSNDITKSNAGNTQGHKKNNSSVLKIFSGEYDDSNSFFSLNAVTAVTAEANADYTSPINKGHLLTLQQPPDSSC